YIDYGLGCLSAEVFNGLSGNFDLAQVYTALSQEGRLAGFEVSNRFYEIGSPNGLSELGTYLEKQ
ncbi:MAG: nucleotidyl transferase, partial [Deltaproteobacteria bacterium]|nr:nucleotidyl transferase [Deltaproteobacteria bacterium]